MLVVHYDPLLVIAAVLVAVMASFTGLRLASGLSQLDYAWRKGQIAMASVALSAMAEAASPAMSFFMAFSPCRFCRGRSPKSGQTSCLADNGKHKSPRDATKISKKSKIETYVS